MPAPTPHDSIDSSRWRAEAKADSYEVVFDRLNSDVNRRSVVRQHMDLIRKAHEVPVSPHKTLTGVQSSAVFGRLQTDGSRRLKLLHEQEELRRLEAELTKTVSDKRLLSRNEAQRLGSRLNGKR